jgi:predicted methyltransferase
MCFSILNRVKQIVFSLLSGVINGFSWLFSMSRFYCIALYKKVRPLSLNQQAVYQLNRLANDKIRDTYRKPIDILNFVDVKPSMQIIDLLGGGGYYTELFSYIVGERGKVYLQNNSLFLRFSTQEMEKRLKNNRLKNVVRLDSEYADMKLPTNTDIIFAGISFHDFFVQRKDGIVPAIPQDLYRQLREALKPNGNMIIIDHSARKDSNLEDTYLHRIDEEWLRKDLENNGFQWIESIDTLRQPNDDLSLDIWNKKVKNKTDQFIHKYKLKN